MTEYDKTNRWTLNKNKDKREDRDRDYGGTVNIEGREYWLNGWIKQGPNGTFISGTVKLKEVQPAQQPQPSISQRAQATVKRPDPISSGPQKQSILPVDDMNDEIPF